MKKEEELNHDEIFSTLRNQLLLSFPHPPNPSQPSLIISPSLSLPSSKFISTNLISKSSPLPSNNLPTPLISPIYHENDQDLLSEEQQLIVQSSRELQRPIERTSLKLNQTWNSSHNFKNLNDNSTYQSHCHKQIHLNDDIFQLSEKFELTDEKPRQKQNFKLLLSKPIHLKSVSIYFMLYFDSFLIYFIILYLGINSFSD